VYGLLQNVSNYSDELVPLIAEAIPNRAGAAAPEYAYWRVDRKLTGRWVDPVTGTTVTVPGIIMEATTLSLRTDGVICEALLGNGDALDDYSRGLQRESVVEKQLDNEIKKQEVADAAQRLDVVQTADDARADLYVRVHPTPPAQPDVTP
jgi:hypothetical protein